MQRCKELRSEMLPEDGRTWAVAATVADRGAVVADLLLMFPSVEPELVQALTVEATSKQQAVEWLLTLSGGAEADAPAPARLSEAPEISDAAKFPVLVASDGWQVASQQQLSDDRGGDTAQSWSDRVRSAAGVAAPPATKTSAAGRPAATGGTPGQQRAAPCGSAASIVDAAVPLTEYEARHVAGRRRAERRARFGAACRGGAAGGGWGVVEAASESASESEEEEDVDNGRGRVRKKTLPAAAA
jgi:hypothetical protein